ncbi:MAG TPA: anti-sigma factor [Thermoleophilaceae bacterium]
MTARDHERFRDDVGAYLLGALDESEGSAFEAHLELCHVCRDDVERLRPAVAALPRSVEQFDPPPSLKRSLMETVEAEARERAGEPEPRPRASLRQRLGGLAPARPRTALVAAALVLALAVAGGFGLAQLLNEDQQASRTVAAKVDQRRVPGGQASLDVEGDGSRGGILRVSRFRQLRPGRTYQAWTESGGQISPQPTFEVSPDGRGAVALPTNLKNVQKVYVSREPRGGSTAPSEVPIVQVEL